MRLGSKVPVFNAVQEKELVQHLLQLEERFYGLSMRDVKELAFELAERNNLPHPFNKALRMAGQDWLNGFLLRNPKISFRKPEATSAARARGFNKPSVTKYFDLLKAIMQHTRFEPTRIYNADKTAVPPKKRRIAALKGKNQVGSITSAERGETITAVLCMSAAGHHLPPFLIFPRVRMHEALKKGAPVGTEFSCNPSGYMTVELFNIWFDHFLKYTRPSEDSPVLLIIDGHSSHTKNLMFSEKARANHVTVVVLPPHCSHKLQPLDVAFMAPFKNFYADAVEKFMWNNPGRTVGQYDIAELLCQTFTKASTTETARSGFYKTGIVPFDPKIFGDEEYAPSHVTDQDVDLGPKSTPEPIIIPEPKIIPSDPQPSTSKQANKNSMESQFDNCSCSSLDGSFKVSPSCVKPLPKLKGPRISKRKRVAEKSSEITSDEYMADLKKARASKEIQNIKKARKPRSRKSKGLKTSPIEEDTLCDKCGEVFSDSNDGTGWMSCFECGKWFHDFCFESNEAKCYECS
ncbi:uncharacterized protein LOC128735260 [Sabethes cyaneus]|uniref:uncharacterized protein LOC128735260 n=1 Tax=Sabethes cyaneus TaxID=53552 RepID=UPI00237DE11B|nr:uncharacterized protein LOC128735260 [Sabethes cyaneus]